MFLAFYLLAAVPITEVANAATIRGFDNLFSNLITAVLALAGIALFLMLTVGGFRYITSGGDPKATEAARKTLTFAILGLVLVASAYLFLRFIAQFTGVDVLNFNVYYEP